VSVVSKDNLKRYNKKNKTEGQSSKHIIKYVLF
jgi:hypothetical protein